MTDLSPSPLSVVLLGYGLGGRVFHGPLVSTTPGLSLDAIVTGDPDRQAQARSAYPDAVIYDSPEQAWSGGHDLAVISTANVTHVDYATAALGSGLNVVLDKPIAPTASAATALGVLASEHGLLLVPFQNRRWDSDFLTLVAVADSGDLGTVHRFESRIERMRVVPKGGWRDSTDPQDMGGMLYDLGAHVVDQALLLMGPVVAVTASVRSVRSPGATDDDVTMLLEHESGAVSVLTVSQVGAFAGPRFTLYGTRGGLRIDASDSQEAALVGGLLPDRHGRVGRRAGRHRGGSPALRPDQRHDPYPSPARARLLADVLCAGRRRPARRCRTARPARRRHREPPGARRGARVRGHGVAGQPAPCGRSSRMTQVVVIR
jgi:scyllo-inositol 2-dehydrogenase (NADP+)